MSNLENILSSCRSCMLFGLSKFFFSQGHYLKNCDFYFPHFYWFVTPCVLAFCGFVGEFGSITSNFLFQLIYGGFLCRRGQPTIEFIFAATEEAIFVHVIISAK